MSKHIKLVDLVSDLNETDHKFIKFVVEKSQDYNFNNEQLAKLVICSSLNKLSTDVRSNSSEAKEMYEELAENLNNPQKHFVLEADEADFSKKAQKFMRHYQDENVEQMIIMLQKSNRKAQVRLVDSIVTIYDEWVKRLQLENESRVVIQSISDAIEHKRSYVSQNDVEVDRAEIIKFMLEVNASFEQHKDENEKDTSKIKMMYKIFEKIEELKTHDNISVAIDNLIHKIKSEYSSEELIVLLNIDLDEEKYEYDRMVEEAEENDEYCEYESFDDYLTDRIDTQIMSVHSLKNALKNDLPKHTRKQMKKLFVLLMAKHLILNINGVGNLNYHLDIWNEVKELEKLLSE